MNRNERFALFIQELDEAKPAATLEEARMLLDAVLDKVEDQHSGADFNPSNWRNDGRLYPPQDDREIAVRSGSDGVVLDKPGSDGECCPSLTS